MEIESQNQYKSTPVLTPKYRLDEVTRKGYGGDVTMSAGGGETLIFEMTPEPFNPARSVLAFDAFVTLQAGDNTNLFVNNLPFFRELQFYGKHNTMLCNITSFDVFTRIMANSDHSLDELKMSDLDYPLHQISHDSKYHTADGKEARYQAGSNAGVPYEEQAYLRNQGDGVNNILYYRIPLSYFKNTILAEDKDIVFDDITYLKLVLNPVANVGFKSDDLAKAGIAPLTGPVILKNIKVYQAKETNDAINTSLIASLNAGTQEINFSDVDCQNYPASSNSQRWYAKYDRSKGRRLKRIYWTLLPQAPATINLRYMTNNLNGLQLTSFTTALDNKMIQEYTINCTDAEGNQDFVLMRPLIKGGAIQGKNIYQYNWFWCENFGPEQVLHEHDSTKEGGVVLTDSELRYDVKATVPGAPAVANNYYVFAVTQRTARITKAGISIN